MININEAIENARLKSPSLTIDKVKELVPSAFKENPKATMSKDYVHMPTSILINDLISLGWEPIQAQEVKTRKEENKGYQKHLVRFRMYNMMMSDGLFPEIVLTNSHDGKNAFNIRVGLYRVVCANGLIVADKEFGAIRVRHMGYTFEDVKKASNDLIAMIPNISAKINQLTERILTDEEMMDFALKAQELRWKGKPGYINHADLLESVRGADDGNGLWEVYNKIQEKLITGGIFNLKGRKMRPIKGIDKGLKINQELWAMAESYL